MSNINKIGIGIDTGGTYTDGVIFDFNTSKVLASAKSLTTKEDLSIGIINVIKELPKEYTKLANIVSLSTTLATNACVENKGGRAKLIFLGVHPKVVKDSGANYGLPNVEEIFINPVDTKYNGYIGEINYDEIVEVAAEHLNEAQAIGLVEVYAMNNGAIVEKNINNILKDKYNLPIVCGHELYNNLNVLGRGASTLLNARLLPIIDEFLNAIKKSLKENDINAPITIIRSDCTIMSEEFTSTHPVETLLCGPAASVLGGKLLANEENCIIIDMGGTTTDIAIIKNNIPLTANNGIKVGKWKTFVKGLLIETVGLGGDSAIRFNKHGDLQLKSAKITPLCVLADKYPQIIKKLQAISTKEYHTHLLHEFFYLVKDITNDNKYTVFEKRFCAALRDCPLSFEEAALAVDSDTYNLNVSRLEKEGIVMRSGITPTDIMHIQGDFNKYNIEASLLGCKFMANCLGISVEDLCKKVYDMVKKKLFKAICTLLIENKDNTFKDEEFTKGLNRIIDLAYEQYKNGNNTFFDCMFKTKAKLVGIGAPIHIFLPDVAKALNTECIIPPYAAVANAVGALAGKISANCEIYIRNHMTDNGADGYNIHTPKEALYEKELEDAIKIAKSYAKEEAINKAKKRGAINYKVNVEVKKNTALSRDNTEVFLGTVVIATATEN